MINIFGTTIEAPKINDSHFIDNLLVEIAKKDSERKILKEFLIDKLEEITQKAISQTESMDVSGINPQTLSFYLTQLKLSGAFENMVLKTIDNNTSRQILQGKSPILPPDFPGQHKLAEVLVYGSISSSIGSQECRQYLTYRNIQTHLQSISKDLFYATNNGLNVEQSLRFMGIMYEFEKLKTTDFTNSSQIKKNIVNSIVAGVPLALVHIKCLRFTYPGGDRLSLLTHTLPDNNPSNFSRRPQDESPIFDNLMHVKSVISNFGINVQLTLLVSDQDIIDYFPRGGDGIIPDEDIISAQSAVIKYAKVVQSRAPFSKVELLRQYLECHGLLAQFEQIRDKIISELNRGQSTISEKFVESKVNYRFESNSKIFKNRTDRNFARTRVYSQVASLQALSVLGQDCILIEEDHGNDNRFIGGYKQSALPVIFVELKNSLFKC